jgi:hypothetical protein
VHGSEPSPIPSIPPTHAPNFVEEVPTVTVQPFSSASAPILLLSYPSITHYFTTFFFTTSTSSYPSARKKKKKKQESTSRSSVATTLTIVVACCLVGICWDLLGFGVLAFRRHSTPLIYNMMQLNHLQLQQLQQLLLLLFKLRKCLILLMELN